MSQPSPANAVLKHNKFAYWFVIVTFALVLLWYSYGLIDGFGLHTWAASGKVIFKQYNAPGTTYHTIVVGGRPWVHADPTAETYVVCVQVAGEETAGLVSPDLYKALNVGDEVTVQLQRTRLSRRLSAIEINK